MADKDPKRVAAGKVGAVRRWGPPRVVRLDGLTPAQRRLVLALIDAAKEVNRDPDMEKRIQERLAERESGDG